MVKESEYTIKPFYQGGASSFSPTGYSQNIKTGSMGLTTDPRNANLIKEVSDKLSSGVKNIEVEWISPQVFDATPKQHLDEVRRLTELTGIDVSVHGPVVDAAGMTQQGWSEVNREASERRIVDTLLRANELKPKKNINVTFHSSEGTPGTEFQTLGEDRKAKKMIAVNRENGQITALEHDEKYYPGLGAQGESIRYSKDTPEENLRITNSSQWDNQLSQLTFNQERADQILQKDKVLIEHLYPKMISQEINPENLSPTQAHVAREVQIAHTYLDDLNKQLGGIFSKAYKYGTKEQQEVLKGMSEKYGKIIKENRDNPFVQSQATKDLLIGLRQGIVVGEAKKRHISLAPEIFVPIETFANEQASKTFGSAAFEAYKKLGTAAPVISIENPPVGHALSTGEDIANLVKSSREEFVKKATENKKMSEQEAKKAAEKLIGATWDVGHINMLKQHGFGDKEIIEESKKVAPYLKHVHFSDNFGLEHTEIPMGMGNVPLKEIMEKLGQKGYEASKIIEASGWWQHFRSSPVKESFEYIGSPIYSEGAGPFWNQNVGFYQGYGGDMGMFLPQINYETFGGGFGQLPVELGGQRGQGGARMGGGGME